METHGNSKVRQPKAGVGLERATFLALDFQCTLQHMAHLIIVNWIFSTNHVRI